MVQILSIGESWTLYGRSYRAGCPAPLYGLRDCPCAERKDGSQIQCAEDDFQRYAEGSRKSEQVPWDDVFDTLRRLEKVTRKEVRLNFIGFQVEDDDRRQMRRLVRRTGGKYRDF